MIKNLVVLAVLAAAGFANAVPPVKGQIEADKARPEAKGVRTMVEPTKESREDFRKRVELALPSASARSEVQAAGARIMTKGTLEALQKEVETVALKYNEISALPESTQQQARAQVDVYLMRKSSLIALGSERANGREIPIDSRLTGEFLEEALAPSTSVEDTKAKLEMLDSAARLYGQAESMLRSGEVKTEVTLKSGQIINKGNPVARAVLAAAMKFYFEKNGIKNPTMKDMLSIKKNGSKYNEFMELLRCLLGESLLKEVALAA